MAKVYNGASDFVLFSREQSFFDTFDPQVGEPFNTMRYNPSATVNMHQAQDFSGHASTSYDSYPQVTAYSSATSAYFGARSGPFEAHKGSIGQSLQRHTPSGSPSPAASQTFDNPSSSLSSASGASAQSTASSADGSPYANPQHSLPFQEKWEPLGLGIGPEIVSGESFNFDHDLLSGDGKFHCVGEYNKNFSVPFPISHSVASSISSGSSSQNVVPALSSSLLAGDTKNTSRDATIDSILREANTGIQDPTHLISPVSTASTVVSPTLLKHHSVSPVERKDSFRSPVTPASAVSRIPPPGTSPYFSNNHVPVRHAFFSSNGMKVQNSPQQSPNHSHLYGRPSPPPTSPSQAQFHTAQNPFFGQSSGRFVAPLELSCWFSLPSPFHQILL